MTLDRAAPRLSRHPAFFAVLLFGTLIALQAPLLYAHAYYEATTQSRERRAAAEQDLARYLSDQKLARANAAKALVCANEVGALCWPGSGPAAPGNADADWLALDADLNPCAPAGAGVPRDRELEAEWRNILKELRNRPAAASEPPALPLRQYWTRYGAEPRLVTVAPLGICNGRPQTGGLLVHSETLGRLLASAGALRGATGAPQLHASPPAGGSAYVLTGFRPGERFYLSYAAPAAGPPGTRALWTPSPALGAWAALQLLITVVIFYLFGRGLYAKLPRTPEVPVASVDAMPPSARQALHESARIPATATPPSGPHAMDPGRLRSLQDRTRSGALVAVPSFDINGALLPADPPGGDLYFQTRTDDGCTALLFADASGRGAAATLVALHAALLFQKHARNAERAGEILDRMNRDFADVFQGGEFLTCAVCRLNPGTLQAEYASAGSNDAYFFAAAGGDPLRFNSDEGPLGANPTQRYTTLSHALKPGDRVALISDGALLLTDSAGETYGPVRFERWMQAARSQKHADLAVRWLAEAERFRGGAKLQDDLAILCIEARTPATHAAQPGAQLPAPSIAAPATAPGVASETSGDASGDVFEGLLARARAAYAAGRYGEAVRDYERALQRNPAHDATRFNLALAQFRNGEAEAARRSLGPFLVRYPNSERARALERALTEARSNAP